MKTYYWGWRQHLDKYYWN